jgi:ParB/RepB/Spo0J family partition protein
MSELEDGQKINTQILIDPEVVLHPEISKWRDALTVDLALLRSLKSDGQISPTIFRIRKDGKHELIAGARRYFHQKLLKTPWEDIPKDVRTKMTDRQALVIAASENIFRQDFSPWEEARAINSLVVTGNVKPKALAKKLGKSISYIYSRMALLQLPEKIQKRFESKGLAIGYATHVAELSEYPEAQDELVKQIIDGLRSRYSGISKLEEAERFVAQVKKSVADKEALLAKYGPCPACESKDIKESWGEEHLNCGECGHSWHGITREPWEYYETKQKMEELGFTVEEGLEKVTLTPKDVATMVQRKAEEKRREEEEKEEELPKNFRSKVPLLTLLQPMIEGDNIQKMEIRDEKIEIQLIEGFDLYFNGLRKDYKAGEKARIETAGWGGTESVAKNHEWVNNLTPKV